MKNCIHLKQKLNRTLFCKKQNKIINIGNCKSCKFHQFPENRKMVETTIKKRTNKQQKKEKERFSIIYQDLSKCCECECVIGIEKHEVYYGRNRQNSIKYGMVIPLCAEHHTGNKGIHFNNELDIFYKRLFQKKFEENNTRGKFIEIFGRNYL